MAAKKKKADVWMPLYVSDYLSDTMHLTTEQHGAFLLLLMAAWKSDARLPNDPEQLQAICRMTPAKWKASEPILKSFFFVTSDYWINNRLREELDRARKITADRAASGKKRGACKVGNGWQTHDKLMANASQTFNKSMDLHLTTLTGVIEATPKAVP